MILINLILSIIISTANAANCDTHTSTGIAGGLSSCPANSTVSIVIRRFKKEFSPHNPTLFLLTILIHFFQNYAYSYCPIAA